MAKILLIDDDQDLSNLTKMALVKKGHRVFVSHEAKSAMEEAIKQKPELILMDVMLPGMNGAEIVKRMKLDPNLKDIPVVFLTALVSNNESNLEESGIIVDGLQYKTLGKPYEIDELLELVQDILS